MDTNIFLPWYYPVTLILASDCGFYHLSPSQKIVHIEISDTLMYSKFDYCRIKLVINCYAGIFEVFT